MVANVQMKVFTLGSSSGTNAVAAITILWLTCKMYGFFLFLVDGAQSLSSGTERRNRCVSIQRHFNSYPLFKRGGTALKVWPPNEQLLLGKTLATCSVAVFLPSRSGVAHVLKAQIFIFHKYNQKGMGKKQNFNILVKTVSSGLNSWITPPQQYAHELHIEVCSHLTNFLENWAMHILQAL